MTHDEARLKLNILQAINGAINSPDSEDRKKLLEALWALHVQPLSGGGPGEEK